MAIFIKISVSRKQLTTLGIAHICVVLVVFGIIQRNMQHTESFTDEQEWRPHPGDRIESRPNVSQSSRSVRSGSTKSSQSAPGSAAVALFTTFDDDARLPDPTVYRNTLRNWSALRPLVLPILFVDPASEASAAWAKEALSFGWQVRNISRTLNKLPILKDMFLDVVRRYRLPFCGYAKPNVLFDGSLIDDMRLHVGYANAYENRGGLLLIGGGIELPVSGSGGFDPADLRQLAEIAETNGSKPGSYMEDYLVTTRRALPWSHTPDLVVGDSGYGRWLVVKARICNVTVIDASYTLTALRQTADPVGRRSGQDLLRCVNRRFARMARFDCSKGVAECAPYVSHADKSGTLKLYRRSYVPYWCAVDNAEPCIEDPDHYQTNGAGALF